MPDGFPEPSPVPAGNSAPNTHPEEEAQRWGLAAGPCQQLRESQEGDKPRAGPQPSRLEFRTALHSLERITLSLTIHGVPGYDTACPILKTPERKLSLGTHWV